MDVLFRQSGAEKSAEKRSRLPWGKKSKPLTTSILSSKPKPSEEWHQSIDATAGVLHPSDPKFPWNSLRTHTDAYLKKKGKVSQTDADIRLTILIDAHDAKDIAIAAAAHAMTATSLRALLHADLNVAQGNYFGLKIWLQCLIAANEGNPASITDLEALWARKLLPFATQGPRAAEWYLVGASRTLREMSIPNMSILPEFSTLMSRAMADHSAQLEGYRLRNQWTAAREAVLWMVELARTSPPITPPGHLLPEHIFDSQFPVWRMWASWQPRLERVTRFAGIPTEAAGMLSDLLALEGPDLLTGRAATLREGLIMQYSGDRTYLQYRGIVVHVFLGTKEGLQHILERTAQAMEHFCSGTAVDTKLQSKLLLFRDLVLAKPITIEHLDIFEATLQMPDVSPIDSFTTVRQIYTNRESLGGEHITYLRDLIRILDNPQTARFRALMVQPWLYSGIEKCLQDCRNAVRSLIEAKKQWTYLAIELHEFCLTLKACSHSIGLGVETTRDLAHLPTAQTIKTAIEVYEAAKAHHLNSITQDDPTILSDFTSTTNNRKDSVHPNPVVAKSERHVLEDTVETFCIDRLLERGTIDQSSQRTMTVILNIWETTANQTIDLDRRELAILVVCDTKGHLELRYHCLAEIAVGKQLVAPETFAKDLISAIKQSSSDISAAIVTLTKILEAKKTTAQCWKDLLYMWLQRQNTKSKDISNSATVLEYSLRTMRAADWLIFLGKLEALFPNDSQPAESEEQFFPSILQPKLLAWKAQVVGFAEILTRLEAVLGENLQPIWCILTYMPWKDSLLRILQCLAQVKDDQVELLMQKVVGSLLDEDKNIRDVKECCEDLIGASSTSVNACEQIWDAYHGRLNIPGASEATSKKDPQGSSSKSDVARKPVGVGNTVSKAQEATHQQYTVPPEVVEVMVAGWFQDNNLNVRSKNAILSLARVLKIKTYGIGIPQDVLKIAAKFWGDIESEMIKEAERLEGLQKSLKVRDPKGTKALLKQLGIPDTSRLEEEIAKLPAGVIDMVEKTGEFEVEISFPLTGMNELQRNAMGVRKGAKSVLLRLYIDFTDQPSASRFCTHYDNDKDLENLIHSQWTCKKDASGPQDHVCNSPQSAFIWQLNRILQMQLRDRDIDLVSLHSRITKRIQDSTYACISCGTSHNADNARLRRATPCDTIACTKLWEQLPLEVRIPELRTDIFAVDVMLMSVYAAAVSGRPELLPGCPFPNLTVVKAILDLLPTLSVIRDALNPSIILKSYHPDAEKLISWACTHYRGVLATATGICKIPSLPKIHQFVLANASPTNEKKYMNTLPKNNPKTQVLFHGTTFDRLPSIFAQGLKVCSGTPLQRTGAAHGKGIYMADDPALSLQYAPVTMSWRNSGLSNTKLILGCEVSGYPRSVGSTIHIVSSPETVVVRYIFLLPNGTSMPIPGHIVPAMASAMSALRTGAV